jgi:hypothetical protein
MSSPKVSLVPHSWPITLWPAEVYPNDPKKGRYIVRAHKKELVAAGALTRIGRDLVVFGAGYSKWLALQAGKVAGFEVAANRERGKAA